jgi:hypothetical protein
MPNSESTNSSSNVQPAASTSAASTDESKTKPGSASTTISSVDQLKTKAPEVWNQMLVTMGTKICNEMKHHQDRIKELNRKMNSPS